MSYSLLIEAYKFTVLLKLTHSFLNSWDSLKGENQTLKFFATIFRDGSRNAATSKVERFVIIANGWKPLTIITKLSILDVAAVLDPSLIVNVSKNITSSINSPNHFWSITIKQAKLSKSEFLV